MKRALTLIRSQKGYNLIEAAIVLGVAGLIVGGVFAAWNAVTSASKMRRAQDQVTVIVNQVRSAYGNRASISDSGSAADFTNALVAAGLLPETWMQKNGATTVMGNPYGGTVLISPTAISGSTNNAFSITLDSVQRSDCYKLTASILGMGRSQGLYKIGSTAVDNNTSFANIRDAVCTTQTVQFSFKLKTD